MKCESLFRMHVRCACLCVSVVSNRACSHLYIYENTSPHRLRRCAVLTLGTKGKTQKQLIPQKELQSRC